MVDPNDVTAMTPLKLAVADTVKESTRSLLTVVLARRGEIVDEISVEVGDQVEILQEFDDGWAKGRLVATAKICVGLVVFAGFAVIAILNQRRQNRASLSSDLPMLRLDLPANYGAFGFSARSSHNGEATRDGLAMTSEPTDSARLSNDTEIPLLVARQAGSVRSGTVARLYRPARTDELRLRLQQRVDMLEEFADGWAKGRVYVAGGDSVVGVFPIDCVEFDE
ncbi:hypothetical protein HDU82_005678 [Entophlyctis luteolus]|nr:hypothetical protein HDU82_005678 [Entophlyctis luteolus]